MRVTSQSIWRMGCERTGYTVFELIIVVVLVAVLSAVAVPRMFVLREQFQLSSDTRLIAIELRRTRMKAVAENRVCRLVLYTGGGYRHQCMEGESWVNRSGETALGKGITFVSTVGGLPQPAFSSLGTLANDVSITITNRLGQRKVVRANVLGRITVQ
jgi:Tfp pilus assembly protein FimT